MTLKILRALPCAGALLLALSGMSQAAESGGLRLIDTSIDILLSAGTSTWDAADLEGLQAGDHDPKRRGFTFQQCEFSLFGDVDPYFRGESHIVLNEEGAELEEAFGVTQGMPGGLEIKAGQFFAEFGRVNSRHPHAWGWLDQPVIHSRVFGPDGMRAAGARLAWLLPTPFYSQFFAAAMNGQTETMASFVGRSSDLAGQPAVGLGGSANPVVGLIRWENSAELVGAEAVLGLSAALGENSVGGKTSLYGADLAVKWVAQRNSRGYPFVMLEAEYLERQASASTALPEFYRDQGLSVQAQAGWRPGWKWGLRADWAVATGTGLMNLLPDEGSRALDPWRQDRCRLSPLLTWQASEFSRLRLQYNYDFRATTQGPTTGHTVWLGLELLYGLHPAHKF